MKKPYITLEEALAAREEGRRSVKFLTEANGCINGCCSGVTICSETEFNPEPGFHDDQEGFFVLEGDGIVRLDNEEFEVKAGYVENCTYESVANQYHKEVREEIESARKARLEKGENQ